MKITVKDFNYRGHHFDSFECEMPQLLNLEDTSDEEISRFIACRLDDLLDRKEYKNV